MPTKQVSFRIDEEKIAALDQAAFVLDRDRSYIINQAVDAYLEVYNWQTEHIRKAKARADAGGSFLAHDDVKAWVASLDASDKPRRTKLSRAKKSRAGNRK